jgi:CTP synthase
VPRADKLKNHKYIFVVGGVMSGVGKGIATSSIGKILQARGFKINPVKIDPYLNVDAGTMNPTEHGEVFVLDSGVETDQDMGNYERFLDISLSDHDYITSGMVYRSVIERERSLGYKGKCVEAIPHIRDEIVSRITRAAEANGSHISVIEIGGTIGDYQNIMFIEASRVLKGLYPDNVLFVMVSYLPIPSKIGEMKTRPTQNAVRLLNSYGVQPDIVIARSERPLDKRRKEKIAIPCNIAPDHVISAPDISSIYEVPVNFERDKLAETILSQLKLKPKKKTDDLKKWKRFVEKCRSLNGMVNIAIVGKYFDTGDFVLSDAYISVIEAIKFSSYHLGVKPVIHWVDSKDFENGKKKASSLAKYDGIIVPGGFGETGIEGKLNVIKYARVHRIPYFGLCYGMQLALVEFARNVLKIRDANTAELDEKGENLIVDFMPDQREKVASENYGGSMRLGSYTANLKKGSIAGRAYKRNRVSERHRHRYEINPSYVVRLVEGGVVFSGVSPDGQLMEIMELARNAHPFFVGTQFHPEFTARPLNPHPLFTAFIKASREHKKQR